MSNPMIGPGYNDDGPSPMSDSGVPKEPTIHSVYVDRIPAEWTEENLMQEFSRFGQITRTKIMVDQVTGKSLGFGFVHYSLPQECDKAIEAMNQKEYQGKLLVVRQAKKRNRAGDVSMIPAETMNLYVSGLANHITEAEVKAMFAPFGTVTSVTILKPKQEAGGDGTHRGVSFVHFSTASEGMAAIKALHGTQALGSTGTTLTVKAARPKQQQPLSKMARINGPSVAYIHPSLLDPYVMGTGYSPYAALQPGAPQHLQRAAAGGLGPQPGLHGGGSYVMMGGSNSWRSPSTGPAQTLFVYHVPQDITEEILINLFAPFGTITRANVIKDRLTNQPKGYAFVTYQHTEDALQAIQQMNGRKVGNKYLSKCRFLVLFWGCFLSKRYSSTRQ
eukprot:g7542.t1